MVHYFPSLGLYSDSLQRAKQSSLSTLQGPSPKCVCLCGEIASLTFPSVFQPQAHKRCYYLLNKYIWLLLLFCPSVSQGLCIKASVPSPWPYRELAEPLRCGINGGRLVYWGRGHLDPGPVLPSCFLSAIRWLGLPSHIAHKDVPSFHRPKATGPSNQ